MPKARFWAFLSAGQRTVLGISKGSVKVPYRGHN